uniref:hypothetical protein n=1 Tax=Capnocytophaga leadbetteri TaxID=327575 RepID=UPI0028D81DB4|nr:hypothetical protein [Capnocytophaga leadbetteri]
MKSFLKRDVRSAIFVVTLLTAGVNIVYVVITNLEPKAFWAMMINVFICLSTGISAGIDIYKIRKKEEQER